jgi:hypothetical protein
MTPLHPTQFRLWGLMERFSTPSRRRDSLLAAGWVHSQSDVTPLLVQCFRELVGRDETDAAVPVPLLQLMWLLSNEPTGRRLDFGRWSAQSMSAAPRCRRRTIATRERG